MGANFAMIDWNLQSRAHECQSCQKPFADREAYHTLLSDEKIGYRRHDVCDACWQTQFSHGANARKGFISHWQGVYEAPPAAAPDPIKHETAESLLRKLIEQNDPAHAAARYILAVMLERKRLLKVRDQLQQDGKRVFVYEHAGNGDVFTIVDPELQLHQLEAVQREVGELMAHGLNPPPSDVAQTPAAPAPEVVAATDAAHAADS
ncbi:MAG TPA: hypothetical protein VI454_17800 [Verrucomicrobiae bacterium]